MIGKTLFTVAAGITAVSAICSQPTTQLPGNAVYKPSGSDTPTLGEPFSITYDGTGLGSSLTFYLLKGPSTNILNIGTIATGVPNCGTPSCTLSWTPSCDLDSTTTNQGYGIQMVDESTCMFQYTTQFGLNAGTVCQPSAPPPSSQLPPPTSKASPPPSSKASPPPKASETPCESEKPPPPPTTTDCDESGTWTTSWKAGPTGGSWGKPSNATNGTSYSGPAGASPTYTGPKSNDAQSFAVSGISAVIALAAAVMLL